jgi:hypothetical protein
VIVKFGFQPLALALQPFAFAFQPLALGGQLRLALPGFAKPGLLMLEFKLPRFELDLQLAEAVRRVIALLLMGV